MCIHFLLNTTWHHGWQGFHKEIEDIYQRKWRRWLILADLEMKFLYIKCQSLLTFPHFVVLLMKFVLCGDLYIDVFLWYLQYTIIKTMPVITITSYDKITRWVSYCKQKHWSTDTWYHKHVGMIQIVLTCFRNHQWRSQQNNIVCFISGFFIFPKNCIISFAFSFLRQSVMQWKWVFYHLHAHKTIEIYLTRDQVQIAIL